MKFSLTIFFLSLMLGIYSDAQPKTNVSIGKLYNDYTKFKIENKQNETFTIPALKGKNIIVDFFSSTCIVCFRSMPKIDSLQRKFKNNFEFILIGKEDKNIRSIYKRVANKYSLDLTTVFDSTIFYNLGIQVVPYYIWINKDGVIVATTGPDEVTETNIQNFIHGNDFTLHTKETIKKFYPDKLIFSTDSINGLFKILNRTLIAEWKEGDPFFMPRTISDSKSADKFQAVGVTLYDLYNYAYYGETNWGYKTENYEKYFPFIMIKDSLNGVKIFENSKKRYQYSIFNSATSFTNEFIQKNLKRDLENLTGYQSKLIEVNAPCWILKVTDKNKLIHATDKDNMIRKDNFGLFFKNQTVSKLLDILRQYNREDIPIFNESGINHNIQLQIEADMSNLQDVSKELEKFGLIIEKGKRLMTAIVLELKLIAND